MSYQVLARKWRPQSFSDVVGQQHVLTALANGLTLGRIHHAYLFSGTRGVGKTSIARLLAKGLNCESGITATPCGKCDNCREIEEGRFIDLLEIDAASRTKVEDTRDLLDNVQYAPARGRFKVYLIDEVHMLSRHSFNALLKTLEEPPPHVKFLLATTDPQKLPITILSRCLQFHLKALDVGQIQTQLEKVLSAEHISAETRALQLLARAADGSMRDALSLTDQAIAMGDGQITSLSVSQMLGTLDDEQPLALIEALVSADGTAAMEQIGQAASRGVDWDNLLVETLSLLHQIAMIQLLPGSLAGQPHNEQRLRELARAILPQDLQLYYQTLLVGRKELTFAPDRRMGVEMTFLRALAFHPKNVSHSKSSDADEPNPAPAGITDNPPISAPAKIDRMPARSHSPGIQPPVAMPTVEPVRAAELKTVTHPVQGIASDIASEPVADAALPDATAQLLQARTQLLRRQQSAQEQKKNEPLGQSRSRDADSPLERFANVAERHARPVEAVKENVKKEAYQWKAQHLPEQQVEVIATPKLLRSALEHEKTPELMVKLAQESILRDPWAAELAEMEMPKLVQQLALNSYKEQVSDNQIYLHLRPAQRHLNTANALQVLTEVLSQRAGQPIKLSIIEDDDSNLRTPLEWRQVIYEEKLAQAKKAIAEDNHIQTLCRLFDADLDEDSIRPV